MRALKQDLEQARQTVRHFDGNMASGNLLFFSWILHDGGRPHGYLSSLQTGSTRVAAYMGQVGYLAFQPS